MLFFCLVKGYCSRTLISKIFNILLPEIIHIVIDQITEGNLKSGKCKNVKIFCFKNVNYAIFAEQFFA